MKKVPRDYQKDIIEQVVTNDKSTLIQIPTGGGKTFIAYEIATDLIAKYDQQVLFVAPKENLMHQTAEEFKFAKPHIVHSSNKYDKNIKHYDFKTYPLLISTLQTAYKRDNIDPDVIIIDETHFGFDGKMINTLIQSNKHSRVIGLSATPYDKYGKQLEGFELILDKYNMNYMIKNKYLVPLESYKRQRINLDRVRITKDGDYDETQLEKVVCDKNTIIEIVETTKDKVEESLKTIVFAVTIKHADLLAEAYRNAGFTARSLHSKSQEKDIETIDYFRKGHLKVLVSVSKLTTGFDVPETDCAVIARPTKSQNLYKQMVGRILRLSPETNKTHAVLLDCGNVIDTLGDPLAPIKYNQPQISNNKLKCNECESENLKLKKINNKSFWECQECGHLKKIEEGSYKCSHCNKYSNKNSKFIFTKNKIMLDCSHCGNKTTISEFLGDEELVAVNEVDNIGSNIIKLPSGEYIFFPLAVYEKISKYMKENDYDNISKYISKLMEENNADFNTIWYRLNSVLDKDNQLMLPEHPVNFLLPEANKTNNFSAIKYLLDNDEELKYGMLKDSVLKNLLQLEKYLIENYEFSIEKLFDRLIYDDLHIDLTYALNDNELLNNFFKKYGHLWENINAHEIMEWYMDYNDVYEEDDEYKQVLMELDYFFEQYGINVHIEGKQNSYRYLPFTVAKEFIHNLHLKSISEWVDYVYCDLEGYDKKPNEIPTHPSTIYKHEWTGFGDWLGIENLDIFLVIFEELISDYVNGYNKKDSMYKYNITEQQINTYVKTFYEMEDNKIHEMIANLNYKKLTPDYIKKMFHVQNTCKDFIKKLLENPTIGLEIKIKYILMDENNTDKEKVLDLIRSLYTNINEKEQVKKLINAFKQSKNNLSYTPNFTKIKDSNSIINNMVMQLTNNIENNLIKDKQAITHEEFEIVFKKKTKNYLNKKEKSFSNPFEFKKFLESETYKNINMKRREDLMKKYIIID